MPAAAAPSRHRAPPKEEPIHDSVRFANDRVFRSTDLEAFELITQPVWVNEIAEDCKTWQCVFANAAALRFWGVPAVEAIDFSDASEQSLRFCASLLTAYQSGMRSSVMPMEMSFYPQGRPQPVILRPAPIVVDGLPLLSSAGPKLCLLSQVNLVPRPDEGALRREGCLGYTSSRFWVYEVDEPEKPEHGDSDARDDASPAVGTATRRTGQSWQPPRALDSVDVTKMTVPDFKVQCLWRNVQAYSRRTHASSDGMAWHWADTKLHEDALAAEEAERAAGNGGDDGDSVDGSIRSEGQSHGPSESSASVGSAGGGSSIIGHGTGASDAVGAAAVAGAGAGAGAGAPRPGGRGHGMSGAAHGHNRSARTVLSPNSVKSGPQEDVLPGGSTALEHELCHQCLDESVPLGTCLVNRVLRITELPDEGSVVSSAAASPHARDGGAEDVDGAAGTAGGSSTHAEGRAGRAPSLGTSHGSPRPATGRSPAASTTRSSSSKLGQYKWFRMKVLKIRDPVTGSPALVVQEDDVTAMVLAETRERAANEARKANDNFVSKFSHEIRTPLNGVLGMLQCLIQTDLSRLQRDFVETAAFAAVSLLNTLNDVLEWKKKRGAGQRRLRGPVSRIDAMRRQPTTSVRMMPQLFEELLGMFGPVALNKGILLQLDYPMQLHSDPGTVKLDLDRTRQIVSNFVSNALKYSPPGGKVRLEIRVALADAPPPAAGGGDRTPSVASSATGASRPDVGGDDHDSVHTVKLELSVSDNGPGIQARYRKAVFGQFFRVPGSSSQELAAGSAGLGLAVAKQLAGNMGGDIELESSTAAEDHGSKFSFVVCTQFDGNVHMLVPNMAKPKGLDEHLAREGDATHATGSSESSSAGSDKRARSSLVSTASAAVERIVESGMSFKTWVDTSKRMLTGARVLFVGDTTGVVAPATVRFLRQCGAVVCRAATVDKAVRLMRVPAANGPHTAGSVVVSLPSRTRTLESAGGHDTFDAHCPGPFNLVILLSVGHDMDDDAPDDGGSSSPPPDDSDAFNSPATRRRRVSGFADAAGSDNPVDLMTSPRNQQPWERDILRGCTALRAAATSQVYPAAVAPVRSEVAAEAAAHALGRPGGDSYAAAEDRSETVRVDSDGTSFALSVASGVHRSTGSSWAAAKSSGSTDANSVTEAGVGSGARSGDGPRVRGSGVAKLSRKRASTVLGRLRKRLAGIVRVGGRSSRVIAAGDVTADDCEAVSGGVPARYRGPRGGPAPRAGAGRGAHVQQSTRPQPPPATVGAQHRIVVAAPMSKLVGLQRLDSRHRAFTSVLAVPVLPSRLFAIVARVSNRARSVVDGDASTTGGADAAVGVPGAGGRAAIDPVIGHDAGGASVPVVSPGAVAHVGGAPADGQSQSDEDFVDGFLSSTRAARAKAVAAGAQHTLASVPGSLPGESLGSTDTADLYRSRSRSRSGDMDPPLASPGSFHTVDESPRADMVGARTPSVTTLHGPSPVSRSRGAPPTAPPRTGPPTRAAPPRPGLATASSAKSMPAASAGVKAGAGSVSDAPDTGEVRALIVDDVRLNRRVLQQLLKQLTPIDRCGRAMRLVFDHAEDGQAALDAVTMRPTAYTIVCMDLNMPRMDGWASTAAINKLDAFNGAPIVAVSAETIADDEKLRRRLLSAGFADALPKPVLVPQLEALLTRLVPHLTWKSKQRR